MWLLNTSTLILQDFVGTNIPKYAILSHTWGLDEVSFRDMRKDRVAAREKAGYSKIVKCCERSKQEGLQWAWVDCCCIDKRSSAELSEAINSMFKWYQDAVICYVYLSDVPSSGFNHSPKIVDDSFSKSRWFTRGWTLQELIAPRHSVFLGQDWLVIGEKILNPPRLLANDLFIRKLSAITGVTTSLLRDPSTIDEESIAERMAWASRRETTREEDIVYSLMGLFDISMPILYGEGEQKAFRRLQLEIIAKSVDHSIFVWRSDRKFSGLLAQSPRDFVTSGGEPWIFRYSPFSMTNIGISITLPLQPQSNTDDNFIASLGYRWKTGQRIRAVGIHLRCLRKESENGPAIYLRHRCDYLFLGSVVVGKENWEIKNIYVLENEEFETGIQKITVSDFRPAPPAQTVQL